MKTFISPEVKQIPAVKLWVKKKKKNTNCGWYKKVIKQWNKKINVQGLPLVVQWLRIGLPVQGTPFLYLVRDLTSHMKESESVSCSVVCYSLRPHGLEPTRLLRPWNSPGKNTGVGYHFLLQGIFETQGLNLHLPHCRQILYHLSHQESPQDSTCRQATKPEHHNEDPEQPKLNE